MRCLYVVPYSALRTTACLRCVGQCLKRCRTVCSCQCAARHVAYTLRIAYSPEWVSSSLHMFSSAIVKRTSKELFEFFFYLRRNLVRKINLMPELVAVCYECPLQTWFRLLTFVLRNSFWNTFHVSVSPTACLSGSGHLDHAFWSVPLNYLRFLTKLLQILSRGIDTPFYYIW